MTAPRIGALLGVVLALGALVTRPHHESRAVVDPPLPLSSTGRFVADDTGGLQEILMHYVPELEPAFYDDAIAP